MRNKKGQFTKGQISWNKGKIGIFKHTEKTRKKISETCKEIGIGKWNKNRQQKEEEKQKRSNKLKDYWKNNLERDAIEEEFFYIHII